MNTQYLKYKDEEEGKGKDKGKFVPVRN